MNSTIEMNDAIAILRKLIDRTSEGRLVWQSAEKSYTTTLEPNLMAVVSEGGSYGPNKGTVDFSLVEFDASFGNRIAGLVGTESNTPEKEVLHVSVEKNPSYGYSAVEEKKLAELLRDMGALARRSALNVNSSVERALSYLDKIAG